MSHGHSHAGIMHGQTHAKNNAHEYRKYCWLFTASLVSFVAPFLIALLLAHSVAAQADAIHELTHLSLYAIALWVSKRVLMHNMDAHTEYHYREKFTIFYAPLIFISLAWVCYTSIAKLFTPEYVATGYMLIGVSLGICGKIIELWILSEILNMQGDASHKVKALWLLIYDALGDFVFSVTVLATACAGLMLPWLPIRIIDPILSLLGIVWIGALCIRVLRGKTPHHSH